MEEFIKQIQENRYYKVMMTGVKPVIVFDDHRFVVPVLWLANKLGIIDAKISMVRFDGHYDSLDFSKEIIYPYQRLHDFNGVFEFARDKLGPIDDDWQTFVLHQKLIDRALVFCDRKEEAGENYADRIFSIKRLDGIFGYNGEFTGDNPKPGWDIVGWKAPGLLDDRPVLLDIDCDYFTYQWRGSFLPWQKEFYDKEFSAMPQSRGWSNRSFMELLVAKAPFVTVCLEPDFCGGRQNADKIFEHLNKSFFNP